MRRIGHGASDRCGLTLGAGTLGRPTAPQARKEAHMAIDAKLAAVFGLQGDVWKRHANPWSVYTRIPIPPLLVAAIWTRSRIGWRSLIPVSLVCAWAMINPRAFSPPGSLDHWASRGVLG